MAAWHTDPNLKDRFHPQYPDDLQVLVHEGSFRFTDTRPEVMWARIIAELETQSGNGDGIGAYRAILLNQPKQLKTLRLEQEILLVAHKAYPYAIRVTHDYLADRSYYNITPCDKCGLPELFDPIPKLIEHSFKSQNRQADKEYVVTIFSSFCPVCRGILMVSDKRSNTANSS